MAGGKESPRQKMIGMMYLVLTALLALQVSSAIMEKFKFLDDSLQFANANADDSNTKIERNIEKVVTEGGNKPKDVAVLTKAKAVRKEAEEIKKYIDDLRAKIIKETGGYIDNDPKAMYTGAKEETAVEVMMVGASKNGLGYQLKKEMNQFSDDLSKVTGINYPHIALDAKDDKRISSEDQKRKDFSELNFAQTPMVASMAVLSNMEAEVLKQETDALGRLAGEIGADEIKFDNIYAMYKADSKVVAAGTKYHAELFLTASSSTLKPTVKVNGSTIKVEGNAGIYEITASPGGYDKDGNSKRTFKGEVTIVNKGKDTTFTIAGEYIVARPVISVQSASVSALYRNCGNDLNIQVPALGSTYNPSFSASGAQVITGAQKGLVTLVPGASSQKVTVNVASGGNAIGSQDFAVRGIPKPTIEALAGGVPVNEKTGMACPSSIQMKVIPDESFKTFLPKDARYRVTQWDCILVRGKRPVATKNLTNDMANLSDFKGVALPGDRILIEVKKIVRKNFQNVDEEVNMGSIIKNVPLI
ncbi:MAG TPA: gliding motility protein GldM [Cytophagaceae bacterium]|jgi:gliding motility-associated protein GldM|nr:gliding motility protein GldM [Cytophagaceae bacterium]